jgi:hypothetical protein
VSGDPAATPLAPAAFGRARRRVEGAAALLLGAAGLGLIRQGLAR